MFYEDRAGKSFLHFNPAIYFLAILILQIWGIGAQGMNDDNVSERGVLMTGCETLSEFRFGDMLVTYYVEKGSKRVGLCIIPDSCKGQIVEKRATLAGEPEIDSLPFGAPGASRGDSLVQLKCIGDDYPGSFSQGLTMREGESVAKLAYEKQEVEKADDKTVVRTRMKYADGVWCDHVLSFGEGNNYLEVYTEFVNEGGEKVTLEMLSSFSLGFITPFDRADAAGDIRIHRIRSYWSAEGRSEAVLAEDLSLERSWTGHGVRNVRFGQVGSMPVRGFFPFAAVEDTKAGVVWGAQVAWCGSWQLEVYRKDDFYALSGGLADREFGHWMKDIEKGETFRTPTAILSVVKGDVDALCDRLVGYQEDMMAGKAAVEEDLPVVFNEYCDSWGNPTEEQLVRLADRIKGCGITYLVIDAGWYRQPGVDWSTAHGDWVPSGEAFPSGLDGAAKAIRERGLIPGLWFEYETIGPKLEAGKFEEHLLKRDGRTLVSTGRRFWDMRDEWTREYLTEKVINRLRDDGFGYIKIDYNETIGMGVDGAESLGEGLRENMMCVMDFVRKMRREVPGLVIENCSSGGHRLEPGMMGICDMGSFSDAHETLEIPIIAANMHRVIAPRQSQIWAVLRSGDDMRRISYLLTATFLGRMCLSGEVDKLSDEQWAKVRDGIDFYHKVKHIIKDGRSYRFGPEVESYRHPVGWQTLLRVGADGKDAIAVFHTFAESPKEAVRIELPAGEWEIDGIYKGTNLDAEIVGGEMVFKADGDYDSCVVYLKRK